MELTAFPASAAPDRCTERARRLGQVKFAVLVLDDEPEVPASETLSHAPDSPYRRLRAFLSRVMGHLVAARP